MKTCTQPAYKQCLRTGPDERPKILFNGWIPDSRFVVLLEALSTPLATLTIQSNLNFFKIQVSESEFHEIRKLQEVKILFLLQMIA